jgi:hypothetical protein
MIHIPAFDPIEYLVNRKFPVPQVKRRVINGRFVPPVEPEREYEPPSDEEEQFRLELSALPEEEIARLVKIEKDNYEQEKRLEEKVLDQTRFFSMPTADVDFDYWSKINYWTIEEAVALSFGKNPEKVYSDALKLYKSSPFVHNYKQLLTDPKS